jgi:hypothetical protein
MSNFLKCFFLLIIVINIIGLRAEDVSPLKSVSINDEGSVERYQVAKVNYPRVSSAFEISLWIYLGILTKIGKKNYIDYSCLNLNIR